MVSCPWVTQRLAAGDRLSVRVFLRRINGTLTPAEENEMVRLFIFSLKQYGRCMVLCNVSKCICYSGFEDR